MPATERMAGLDMTSATITAVAAIGATTTVAIPATCILRHVKILRTDGEAGTWLISIRNRSTGYVAAMNQILNKADDANDYDSGAITLAYVNAESGVNGQKDEIYIYIDPGADADGTDDFSVDITYQSRLT